MMSPFVNDLQPPILSIVVPAHNEEHELPRTLEAIEATRRSLDVDSELIVVDDASDDRTAAIAEGHGARVVRVAVRQIAAARNAGAAAARGEWLLFVDADTRVNARTVQAAIDALRRGAVGGGAEVRFEPPVPLSGRVLMQFFLVIWRLTGFAAGCFVFCRKRDFDAVGGFDHRYYASEEVWLSMALRQRGRFVIVREPILTSARKLRMNGVASLLGRSLLLLVKGPSALQRREGLDLWYDGRRER